MKSKTNPDYFVYTDEDEKEFLKNWRPYYERKRFAHTASFAYRVVGDGPGEQGWFPPYRRREVKDHHLISKIYWLGRAYGIVKMDYQQFATALHWDNYYGPSRPYNRYAAWQPCERWSRQKKRYIRDAYEDWYPKDGAHYREKIPLHIPEKKVLSEKELQKREWRKAKGIDRDKTKHGYGHGWRKPRRSGKQVCNREYRRHERKVIQKGNYDRLTKIKPKNYFDPWRFD